MTTAYGGGIGSSLTALFCFFLCSCSAHPANMHDGTVEISVDRASVEYLGEPGSILGSLEIGIRNEGVASIWFNPCGTELEREAGAEWTRVWHAICSLSKSEVEIVSGEVHVTEVTVNAKPGLGPSKNWAPPLDGSYRVHLSIRNQRGVLIPSSSTSRPFALHPRVR
jgi:hypothetical protein